MENEEVIKKLINNYKEQLQAKEKEIEEVKQLNAALKELNEVTEVNFNYAVDLYKQEKIKNENITRELLSRTDKLYEVLDLLKKIKEGK